MFSFQHPAILLALVPLAPLCALRAGSAWRAFARVAVLAALLAAAARPCRERVADVRGGVAVARESGPALRPGEMAGAPGEALQVESADTASALARAAALAGPGGVVVLESPARWSEAQAAQVALEAERSGATVLRWSPPPGAPDAAATAVWVPGNPREGEAFEVLAEIEGLPGARGDALLLADDAPLGRAPYDGHSRVRFLATLPAGFHRLAVRLETASDGDSRNNLALGAVDVLGAPRVLVVEGTPGAGQAVTAALDAQGIAHSAAGTSAWDDFAAIVLAGVDPATLAPGLEEAVKSGTGLLALVSTREAEAWNRHPMGALLPVTFRSPDPTPPPPDPGTSTGPPAPADETPRILLILVIDRSGSMTGDKLRAAKEAAIASASTLTEGDKVGVVAFDSEAQWVIEPTDATQRGTIEDRISRLQAGGETDVHAGLEMAAVATRDAKFPVKHIIVMTDGITPPADFQGLVEDLARQRVSVSTIGLGEQFDDKLLANVAQWGHGCFYWASRPDEIPKIFIRETRRIAAGAPAPRAKPSPKPPPIPPKALEFLPVIAADPDPATEGIEEFPPIAGSSGDAARPDARVLLKAGPRPLLGLRRASLGRVAAFAAPLDGPEAAKWTAWERFPSLAAQLTRSLMRAETGGPSIEVTPDGDRRRVVVRATEKPRVTLDGEELALEALAAGAWSATLEPRAFPDLRRLDAATTAGHSSAGVAWNWPAVLRPRAAVALPFAAWSPEAVAARPAIPQTEREELYGWAVLAAVAGVVLEVWMRRMKGG